MNDFINNEITPVFGDDPSEFDLGFSNQISALDIVLVRIELRGKVIEFNNKHIDATHIYKAIVNAMDSDWYKGLADLSKRHYEYHINYFFEWFGKLEIDDDNRFMLLKNYEVFRVNSRKIKSQSSGMAELIRLIKEGMYGDYINSNALNYLDLLVNSSMPSVADKAEPYTLTNFFSSMPWLREVLGERDYLKLESPKRLMESFSISVAATLLFIIEAKKLVNAKVRDPGKLGIGGKDQPKRARLAYWSRDLLSQVGELTNEGQPANALSELLLLDCVGIDTREELLAEWFEVRNVRFIGLKSRKSKWKKAYYLIPQIFLPEYLNRPSFLEEILFSWLCAWQTVQASDITKLKRQDFIINKNHVNRPVTLQCSYYKGRSWREQELPMIDTNRVEGKAIIAYLNLLPATEAKLIANNVGVNKILAFSKHDSLSNRLARLWKSPLVLDFLKKALDMRQSSTLFIRAYTKMADNCGETIGSWSTRQEKEGKDSSTATYSQVVHHSLPTLLFSLSAIKTSAVHARSDKYRDGDLVNYNSHDSATEKHSYMTDANKEWVNQNGRITRMVLNDIERYVYRPNIDAAIVIARDRLLRTRVVNAVESEDIRMNSLRYVDQDHKQEVSDIELDDVLVWDTPETVVNMLHYIAEAERQYTLIRP